MDLPVRTARYLQATRSDSGSAGSVFDARYPLRRVFHGAEPSLGLSTKSNENPIKCFFSTTVYLSVELICLKRVSEASCSGRGTTLNDTVDVKI